MNTINIACVLVLIIGTLCQGYMPRLEDRIVGGVPVNIVNFPYQLSLRRYGSHICGASIISNSWALTAAHCLEGSVSAFSVRAGSSDRSQGGQVRSVAGYTKHPEWNPDTMAYDYALLRLSSPLVYGRGIQQILLSSSSTAVGTQLTVTGWGTTRYGNPSLPDELRGTLVYVNNWSQCNRAYNNSLTASMFCASYPGRDSCQGDSGGPAAATFGRVRYLVGVVSWGYGCASQQYPGIYSNVSFVRRWIRSVANV